ncbi:MAG: zinc ABC transporter substrate-binding protein [Gammaproteobacteria bacterium]|nr:zinc ABC transporter substrate-binding protein [Gammaproteobacteria bacterium]MCP5136202.1 zinc ABC transporter substrate-binding protein [Gammaproteobacteria bacterium]
MRRVPLFVLLLLCALLAAPAAADRHAPPNAVASILPLHALLAGVMQGVAEPALLIAPAQSPHKVALRPNQARRLAQADLFVWVGEELESGLRKAVSVLPTNAVVIRLGHDADVPVLPARDSAAWAPHHHDDDVGHGGIDPHLWLSPDQAARIASRMAEALIEIDPGHAPVYKANLERMVGRLDEVDALVEQRLAPIRGRPYLVFHDAYQYFERHYRLNAIGSVTIDADHAPGANRIAVLRRRIQESQAGCVFTEPHFEPRVVRILIEGSAAKIGELDPVGRDIEPGPEAYFELLDRLSTSLVSCLGPTP